MHLETFMYPPRDMSLGINIQWYVYSSYLFIQKLNISVVVWVMPFHLNSLFYLGYLKGHEQDQYRNKDINEQGHQCYHLSHTNT